MRKIMDNAKKLEMIKKIIDTDKYTNEIGESLDYTDEEKLIQIYDVLKD
jgi:hypothetical protein